VTAVAYAGWMAALLCGCGVSALRLRLARHAELVADAGHELRGPLCAARLGLHGLDDFERAAAVDLELRRAALALEDLVAAGRGERAAGRSELVDVGALLDDGAEAWRPLAAAFGVVLQVEPLRGRALVRADSTRLAQACGNLVANAVEHGGSPVRVRGRVVAGRVRVEVSDAGPGLPAPVSELARRRGRRAPRGRGLAITARIAESYGGRVLSAPSGRGACLVLELPSADAAPWPDPFPPSAEHSHRAATSRFDPTWSPATELPPFDPTWSPEDRRSRLDLPLDQGGGPPARSDLASSQPDAGALPFGLRHRRGR
jgi:signal transduction histidine kinase